MPVDVDRDQRDRVDCAPALVDLRRQRVRGNERGWSRLVELSRLSGQRDVSHRRAPSREVGRESTDWVTNSGAPLHGNALANAQSIQSD